MASTGVRVPLGIIKGLLDRMIAWGARKMKKIPASKNGYSYINFGLTIALISSPKHRVKNKYKKTSLIRLTRLFY
jgi:hypothetical protein